MKSKIKQSGFTLIETMFYTAMFSMLLGSLLGIMYQTIQGINNINGKIIIQQEANFIIRKINWALSGSVVVNEPSLDSSGNALSVSKVLDGELATLVFTINERQLKINRNGAGENPLTSTHGLVTDLVVTRGKISAQPEYVRFDFKINGEPFSYLHYSH